MSLEQEDAPVQVFGEPTWTPLGWSLSPTRMLEAAELSIRLYTEGQPDVTARIHAIYQTHLNDEENPQAAHYRTLEVSTDRLPEDISDELLLVHNLLANWNKTHERLGRVPWREDDEDAEREPPSPPAVAAAPPPSRGAEKRRSVPSPPPREVPTGKRGRVASTVTPDQDGARPDGKRRTVTIHRGVSSSEGAGSLRPPKKTIKKVVDI
ncbi:hypothetical protein CF328_g7031, partial [Tilletia controversa]